MTERGGRERFFIWFMKTEWSFFIIHLHSGTVRRTPNSNPTFSSPLCKIEQQQQKSYKHYERRQYYLCLDKWLRWWNFDEKNKCFSSLSCSRIQTTTFFDMIWWWKVDIFNIVVAHAEISIYRTKKILIEIFDKDKVFQLLIIIRFQCFYIWLK